MISACKSGENELVNKDVFNNGTSERNLIVVISDMHLGADLAYAECNKNLPALEKFLKQIQTSKKMLRNSLLPAIYWMNGLCRLL